MKQRTILQLCGALALVLTTIPARADLYSAIKAYERRDYKLAFQEFKRLAEQGDSSAQWQLGALYSFGHGVPQDYVQAHAWFNLAAAQGDYMGALFSSTVL